MKAVFVRNINYFNENFKKLKCLNCISDKVFIATLAVVLAEPPSYGVPSIAIAPVRGSYDAPSGGYGGQEEQYRSQTFRHVRSYSVKPITRIRIQIFIL